MGCNDWTKRTFSGFNAEMLFHKSRSSDKIKLKNNQPRRARDSASAKKGRCHMNANTIYEDVSLKPLHTFHLEGEARRFARVDSLDGLRSVLAQARENGWKVHLLGAGANTVFTSRPDGIVVQIAMKGLEVSEADDSYEVCAAAGEILDEVVERLIEMGIGGLENLSSIPGTIGGAVVQNVGAYGLELAEYVESVDVLDADEVRTLSAAECDFGYRSSVFKSEAAAGWVVLRARLRIPKEWMPILNYKELDAELADVEDEDLSPALVRSAVAKIRARKLPNPDEIGNAGSFFKNPIIDQKQAWKLFEEHPQVVYYPLTGRRYKLAAGWLIEAAGMKGASSRGVGVYEKHALILVNKGEGARGEDLLAFKDEVCAKVEEMFGVKLEMEPVVVS